MMITILILPKYYNRILILEQHSIFNVLNGYSKIPEIFQKNLNSFINILEILQDFSRIFSKHFPNTTVLYEY